MIFEMTGGTAALNFKVVAYESVEALLASTPAENTIGVVTITPIKRWLFSATEPTNPESGMVWFSVGTFSTNEFNALKKNGIMVYPLTANQYADGSWVALTAKSYQNEKWNAFWGGEIYEKGVQHLPLAYYQNGAPAPIFEESHIWLTRTVIDTDDSGAVLVYTEKKYDVSQFNKLTLKYSYLKNHSCRTGYTQVGLISDITVNSDGSLNNPVAVAGIELTDNRTVFTDNKFDVDISSIQGQYHIAFSIGQNNSGNGIVRSYDFRVTDLFLS